ncbi:hypothetical protein [Luteolibacter sp. Populi]|uniref:hypothetical protein n=1 Tax=Luteolibacter sp. Populi TaxID=3230487 RepID=UPI003466E132
MNIRILPLLFLVLFTSQLPLRAEEVATLKPEYYEAATNGGNAINYKRWQTSRNGKVILKHEERDLLGTGKFEQIDTTIFHEGKKVVHFITLQGKRMCTVYPECGLTVAQADSNNDGQYDRTVLSDATGRMVDYFTIGADGRISAISDEALKKVSDGLKEFSEGMRDFDKGR